MLPALTVLADTDNDVDAIITRIDEMGARIDDLEKSIADLMQQAGVEEGDAAADAKPKA